MIQGVGLILRNETGHILVVKELFDKPSIGKKAGMLSIPLETMQSGERLPTALSRLVLEEVGAGLYLEANEFGIFPIADTLIHCYLADCDYTIDRFKPTAQDVAIVGWAQPEHLLAMRIRREIPPIIGAYLLLRRNGTHGG